MTELETRWSRIEMATATAMLIALVLLLGATFNAYQNSARLQDTIQYTDIASGNEGDIAPAAGHLAYALERWADGAQVLDTIDVNRGVLIRQLHTAAANAPTSDVRERYEDLLARAQRLSGDIDDQKTRAPVSAPEPGLIRALAAEADSIVTDAQLNRQRSNRAVFDQTVASQRFDDRNRRLAVVAGVLTFVFGTATIGLFRRRLRVNHHNALKDLACEDRRRQAAVELANDQASILEQVAAGAPTGEVHAAIDALADHEQSLETSSRLMNIVRSRDNILGVLAHQATHDGLTGLLNRVALVDALEDALGRSRADGSWVAFLFCDLDRFKFINDTFGHDAGDDLLCQVATRLEVEVGDRGQVGRMGGDEFGVVLTGPADGDRPRQAAHRMVGAVDRLYEVAGRWVDIDVSVGVAVAPDDGIPADELLQRADIALYAAKDQGRSHVAEFDLGLAAEADHRRGVEHALQEAVSIGGLEVHYQPVVPTRGGRPTDIEALVRWRRDGVLLEPAAFLSIAEDAGLIAKIDEVVLAQACRDGAALVEAGAAIGVAVNVSSATLGRPDFVELVAKAVQDAGFSFDLLRLEVTEATLLNDTADAGRKLEIVRGQGAKIGIDDFGTGYSSLQYLSELPLDALKIDRHFVNQLDTTSGDAIVEMIINLARAEVAHRRRGSRNRYAA
ncbi:hypothetical protein ASE48_01225 [Mycobacterium sp. Root265]|nr:EAL domain-containing protein [Mycobacterium sp. Root265]KRD20459.1 hypothetical protein ASE48_01225 [Mycobacterium sp. Root265]